MSDALQQNATDAVNRSVNAASTWFGTSGVALIFDVGSKVVGLVSLLASFAVMLYFAWRKKKFYDARDEELLARKKQREKEDIINHQNGGD